MRSSQTQKQTRSGAQRRPRRKREPTLPLLSTRPPRLRRWTKMAKMTRCPGKKRKRRRSIALERTALGVCAVSPVRAPMRNRGLGVVHVASWYKMCSTWRRALVHHAEITRPMPSRAGHLLPHLKSRLPAAGREESVIPRTRRKQPMSEHISWRGATYVMARRTRSRAVTI